MGANVPPKYAQRFARIPLVFEILMAHPGGLSLDDLAQQVGVPANELRQDLLAFYTADINPMLFGLSRPGVLEFLGPEGDEIDPNVAEVVRIVEERPSEELGVEYVDAAELALIYTAAKALLDIDPDDKDLNGAVDVLTETMFGETVEQSGPGSWQQPLEELQRAVAEHRRVRIVYSRTWRKGVSERVIEPYLLVQTRRGWEIDAGPPDTDGQLRTFLVSNVREYDVLDETFEPPSDLAQRLAEKRTTTRVRVRVPHAARWAADFYAEKVTLVADDELTATLDLELLPPLDQRIGLLLLVAGGSAQVLDPARLVAAGPALAAELLDHHRPSPRA
jgi:proteasome accessory factor C